jgi:hypothetical protein
MELSQNYYVHKVGVHNKVGVCGKLVKWWQAKFKWRKFMCSKWQNDLVLIFIKNSMGGCSHNVWRSRHFLLLSRFIYNVGVNPLMCMVSWVFFPNSSYTKFYDNLNFIMSFLLGVFSLWLCYFFHNYFNICIKYRNTKFEPDSIKFLHFVNSKVWSWNRGYM